MNNKQNAFWKWSFTLIPELDERSAEYIRKCDVRDFLTTVCDPDQTTAVQLAPRIYPEMRKENL